MQKCRIRYQRQRPNSFRALINMKANFFCRTATSSVFPQYHTDSSWQEEPIGSEHSEICGWLRKSSQCRRIVWSFWIFILFSLNVYNFHCSNPTENPIAGKLFTLTSARGYLFRSVQNVVGFFVIIYKQWYIAICGECHFVVQYEKGAERHGAKAHMSMIASPIHPTLYMQYCLMNICTSSADDVLCMTMLFQ